MFLFDVHLNVRIRDSAQQDLITARVGRSIPQNKAMLMFWKYSSLKQDTNTVLEVQFSKGINTTRFGSSLEQSTDTEGSPL